MDYYDSFFWAHARLKKQMRENNCALEADPMSDRRLQELVFRAMFSDIVRRGDGSFDRLARYVEMVREQISIAKSIWNDEEPVLTAYLLGIEAAYTAMACECEKIKKRR